MKRKTSTEPTRVYSYGCLPPVEGQAEIDDQLYRAHRYRNRLCEIERGRREALRAVQERMDNLGPLLRVIAHLEETISEARQAAKAARAGGGDREQIAGCKDAIAEAAADLAVMRLLRSAHKAVLRVPAELRALYALPDGLAPTAVGRLRPWQLLAMAVVAKESGHPGVRYACACAEVEEQAKADLRAARGASGLYPGTYLVVEQAASKWRASPEPPRFVRYDGTGRVAVQIAGGMTAAEVMGCEDTRLRIGPGVSRKTKRNPNGAPVREWHRTVRIRVGSTGRTPVWATLPMTLDRQLPDDAIVKWAWVIRSRQGVRDRYDLQLVLEAGSLRPLRNVGTGTIAIDIGSRDLPGGALRVAYWASTDGEQGEVCAPLTRLSSRKSRGKGRRSIVADGPDKKEDLQAIRSENLDKIKVSIAAYKARAGASEGLQWLRDMTDRVTTWRSPARMARLLREWVRHDGDEDIHRALSEYLDHDRHLLDWQTSEERRPVLSRRDRYRVLAAQWARQYSTIVIAKRDYRRESRLPEDGPATDGRDGRKIMRVVAPGELRDAIRRAALKYGARLVEIGLEGDTSWALDRRVCERLLASADVVSADAAPLARVGRRNHIGTTESVKRRRLGTAERIDPLAKVDVSARKNRR